MKAHIELRTGTAHEDHDKYGSKFSAFLNGMQKYDDYGQAVYNDKKQLDKYEVPLDSPQGKILRELIVLMLQDGKSQNESEQKNKK